MLTQKKRVHIQKLASIRVGGGDTKKDLFLQITLATLKPQNLTFSKDNCVESIKKFEKFETCRTFEVWGYKLEENACSTKRRKLKISVSQERLVVWRWYSPDFNRKAHIPIAFLNIERSRVEYQGWNSQFLQKNMTENG